MDFVISQLFARHYVCVCVSECVASLRGRQMSFPNKILSISIVILFRMPRAKYTISMTLLFTEYVYLFKDSVCYA